MNLETRNVGALAVRVLAHPQGCRTYLLGEPASHEALVLDAHLDHAAEIERALEEGGWRLRWVVDSHTHADHPSAAARLAASGAARVAHARAGHAGVTHRPGDGEPLPLGDAEVLVRHAPGHTPDHLVLLADGALFSGDSLLIGGVARTDFLGGDAGRLHDSIHEVMLPLPDETLLYPGHDRAGRTCSTLGDEKATNPWLRLGDRERFVRSLEAGRSPEPANMAALLRFNREGGALPGAVSGAEAAEVVRAGGAGSIVDVRTAEEVRQAHVPGSRHVVLDQILGRIEEVLAAPPPRLILCHVGHRAAMAQAALARRGVAGLAVIEGGIVSYARAGGELAGGEIGAAPAGGGCCAAPPPATD
jgi:glyoxylase-like metal-dependent hydrolase (beta-lactamase superfamily II)